jgi:NADP-dependent 3-hydroxy acid dehydrogenase YdfG
MMSALKVGITGHCSGLGKELYFRFNSVGFDLKNGFDIAHPSPIVEAISDCNVFINNAYSGTYQASLFKVVDEAWADPNKLIVNISSYAVTLKKNTEYSKNKILLEEASRSSLCRVATIRPTIIDTPMVNSITHREKMNVRDVADVVEFIIKSPVHISLTEITNGRYI